MRLGVAGQGATCRRSTFVAKRALTAFWTLTGCWNRLALRRVTDACLAWFTPFSSTQLIVGNLTRFRCRPGRHFCFGNRVEIGRRGAGRFIGALAPRIIDAT